MARSRSDRPYPMGAFVDSFCDKVGEGGVFLGLLVYFQDQPVLFGLASLAFVAGWLTSWVKAFAEAYRLDRDWSDARILGRAGRAVLLAATLTFASLVAEHTVWAAGLATLLAFNCATLTTRFLRVVES